MKLSTQDQVSLRKIVTNIWGAQVASSVEMNESVGKVVIDTLISIEHCSKSMGLVPRPPNSIARPGLSYIISLADQVIHYLTDPVDSKKYVSCINMVAIVYRSALEEASLGLT